MPPRWISAAIIAGWIAAVAWLFHWEIWPSLEPGSPPPFTIDLVDDAQTQHLPIRWVVSQDDEEVLTATTSVEHRVKENDFTLLAHYMPRGDKRGKLKGLPLRIVQMDSAYRVTPEGRLLGVNVDMEVVSTLFGVDRPCEMRIWGEVRDGQFSPSYELNSQLTRALPRVPVSSQGSVVMPLHPINRLSGLKLGQAWRVPVFDPVSDSLATIGGGEGRVRFLRAKVRPAIQILRWNRTDTRCLVIDYEEEHELKEDKITAETWVNEVDDRVLQQVATLSGSNWVMKREP